MSNKIERIKIWLNDQDLKELDRKAEKAGQAPRFFHSSNAFLKENKK